MSNTKWAIKKLPKTFKVLSKRQNFAKSGNTESTTSTTDLILANLCHEAMDAVKVVR